MADASPSVLHALAAVETAEAALATAKAALHAALDDHGPDDPSVDPSGIPTVPLKRAAERLGVSLDTARRAAIREGIGKKRLGRWFFYEERLPPS
jgi:hypothetical protein